MSKRVKMQTRPVPPPNADTWVEKRDAQTAPKSRSKAKRLTIDLDPELHKQLKVHCVLQGVEIAELMRKLIQHEVTKST